MLTNKEYKLKRKKFPYMGAKFHWITIYKVYPGYSESTIKFLYFSEQSF